MFTRDELLREALSLDPLPASSTRLTRILAEEDWSLEDVARTVALDEVLTGLVLRYANSAACGTQQRITSVNQAVMHMGSGLVHSLALGLGLSRPMKSDQPVYGLGEGQLFRHSITSAIAIENMRRVGKRPPAGCFIAALVHDVGKLVIGRKLRSMGIRLTSGNEERPWVEDEAEQLGIDHAELGGAIARAWELPEGVPEAIEHHHRAKDLEPGSARTIAQFVAAADVVAHALASDGSEDERGIDPFATAQLGLVPEMQVKVRESTRAMVDAVLKLY